MLTSSWKASGDDAVFFPASNEVSQHVGQKQLEDIEHQELLESEHCTKGTHSRPSDAPLPQVHIVDQAMLHRSSSRSQSAQRAAARALSTHS